MGDARLVAALALTDAVAHRPAEDAEEVRWHAIIPDLDGAMSLRPAVELLADAGRLADRVQQHLRRQRLRPGMREVLLVIAVGWRRGAQLVGAGQEQSARERLHVVLDL